ncbi:MAG: DUF2974 domain-containing protein [Oscillospiraceae bacterium]|nr:DUF2974 domain-containing protein [Oscillospiraceae bacterium]
MANIIDYCESELRPFTEHPFSEVDSLVLSQLAYIQFENAVPARMQRLGAPTLRDLYRAELFAGMFEGIRVPQLNRSLLAACAASPRMRDVQLCGYVSQLDIAAEKQFAAVTFLLPDSTVYVAFRGTDGSLVGWKEDFNMAYQTPVPAQEQAALYLAKALKVFSRSRFRVGGHSKGGNLAVFAAMQAPDSAKARILDVFSHDGPGFRKDIFASPAFASVSGQVRKTMPQSAVIGMLLQSQEQYTVVKSDEFWLGQHEPFSWQVENGSFSRADAITDASEFLGETLADWLETLPDDKRQTLVDTVFSLLEATGATTLDELSDNWQQSIAAVYEAGKALDEQTRSWLYSVFVQLGKIAVKNIDILPAAGKAAWEKLQGFLGRSEKDAAAAEETAKA